jgi:hypothetical protein
MSLTWVASGGAAFVYVPMAALNEILFAILKNSHLEKHEGY